MSVPTLRWLQIRRYEQFDAIRIEFSGQENLVLGNNGAGKTSLLKLIRAVLSLDFGELRDRVFDVEFELETLQARDPSAAVVIQGQVRNEVVTKTEMPAEYPESMLRRGFALSATLRYVSGGSTLSCTLKDDVMILSDGASTANLPYQGEGFVVALVRHTEVESPLARHILGTFPVCQSTFVGEADVEFQVLTQEVEYTLNGGKLGGIFVDPQERLGLLLRHDLFGLVAQTWSIRDRDSAAAGIPPFSAVARPGSSSSMEEYTEPLESLQGAMGATQQLLVPKIVREKGGRLECRGLGLRVRFTDGSEVAESELTFGQRRYLYAGLMLLSHPNTPFLIDEIDNGLHPRLIEALLKLLHGRQFFVASHNKIVIDYTNFDGPQDVQKKIHIVERQKDGRQNVVSLDDETARGVYEKISVAIQSPSDVLLAEGLW